jgi:ComF family protein
MQSITDAVGRVIFPPRCAVCDGILEPGQRYIHPKCEAELFRVEDPVCMHCGKPVASGAVEYCPDCAGKKGKTDSFLQGKSLFLYKGEIKKSMYRFKYGNRREYAAFFAEEIAAQYGEWLDRIRPDAIVPVPMYQKKQRKRGYNQAEVLAKALGRQLDLPVEGKWIRRVRDTKPQKMLNDVERKNNLKNAFHSRKINVQYNKILLVDDIYTTGSTAEAVTECLHQANVEDVYFLSVCIGKGN